MIEVYRSGVKALRIAVPDLRLSGAKQDPQAVLLAAEMAARLRKTLEGSGLFEVIDPQAYIEDPKTAGVLPEQQVWSNWTPLGADALVQGRMAFGGGQWVAELRLYDVGLARFRAGKRYKGQEDQLPYMLDRFADFVVGELTGAEGIAASRLAFVSDATGTKELYLMNLDGSARKAVTENGSINLSPHFTRDAKGLLFTSYIRRGKPHLYFFEILTGRLLPFWTQGSLNLGGVESPDGKEVAFIQDDDAGNTNLFIYSKKTRQTRKLTEGYGITVSPTWSPDGARLAYVSDRSGGPQVYVVGAGGGPSRRVTFRGNYNTSPAWSPKGGEIAFVRREGSELNLYLIDTEGAREIQLTGGARSNEDPCWSPQGDYLVFSSNRRGSYDLYLLGAGGHFVRRVTEGAANETQPAWSPGNSGGD